MLDGLYHKDVYLPSKLENSTRHELFMRDKNSLIITNHVLNKIDTNWNRKFSINDINYNKITHSNIIEVEVLNGKIHKSVVRYKLNRKFDICVVILLRNDYDNKCFKIKTCWLNSRYDSHITLNQSKYIVSKN